MPKATDKQQASVLHQRISTLLEELPPSAGICVTRTAILRSADAALASADVAVLKKLHREAKVLLQAIRRSAPSDVAAAQTITAPPPVEFQAGRPRPRRVHSARWRNREHAPIRYPYGKPPHGSDTRLHDTIESMPDSKSSAECLARLKALRRSRIEQHAEELESRQRYGQVRYHGADQPPEWHWPDDPA
jgi:hypothetical protein